MTNDCAEHIRHLIDVRNQLAKLRLGTQAVQRAATGQLPLTVADMGALLGLFEDQLDHAERRIIDALAALAELQASLPDS